MFNIAHTTEGVDFWNRLYVELDEVKSCRADIIITGDVNTD